MIEKLIKSSTDFLVNNNTIDEEDRDVYEYGFHALYNNFILITFIFIVSFLLKQIPQTIIYHVTFIMLRNTAGGFHQDSRLKCFITSALIWFASLWAINNIHSNILYIVLACLSVILIWIFSPVEHYNNPLTDGQKKQMKFLSRTISATLAILIVLLITINKLDSWITASIVFGIASHTLLFVVALIQNKYYKNS